MNINDINPPPGLEQIIFTKIYERQKRSALIRFVGTGVLSLGSLATLVPSVVSLASAVHSSGFYEYLSLIVSDNAYLLTYWKEFSLSLAESLPFFALSLSLALLGIFIWSLSRAAKNIQLLHA